MPAKAPIVAGRGVAPPTTRFGPPTVQAKAAAPPGGRAIAPPPTQFGRTAPAVQAKATASPGRPSVAPPPTRFAGTGAALQAKTRAPERLIAAAPPAARAPTTASTTVQPYVVIGTDKIWTAMPAKRPWFGYPYILIGDVRFVAQERAPAAGNDEAGFLSRDRARIVNRQQGRSIRLSDDHQMAIENSGLQSRQPKAFFLSQAVLDVSNQRLVEVRSPIRLDPTGRSIRVITGWRSDIQLHEVRPLFDGGSADRLPQNCNDAASTIMNQRLGLGATVTGGEMLGLLGKDARAAVTRQDLIRYARGDFNGSFQRRHVNQHANPSVGEAFMIGSNTNAIDLYDQSQAARRRDDDVTANRLMAEAERDTWRDYFDGRDKRLNWPYHYAAVVAVSGSDRITLENYARGDDRKNAPDPRWYFQMYGTKTGQSFHEANLGDSYANPLTIAIRRE
jgi:hypothetical protein